MYVYFQGAIHLIFFVGKTYGFSSIKTLFFSRFHRASRWSTLNSKKNEKKKFEFEISRSFLQFDSTYQSSKGTFLQFVSGVYFFTIFFSNVHLVIGHLVHSSLVEYPWVTSWHFSSNSSLHVGWSSSTSCSWYL